MKNRLATAAALIGLSAFLIGCQTDEPTPMKTENVVIAPPSNLYKCPKVPTVKDIENATDADIAQYINALASAKGVCGKSLAAIKSYVEQAQRTYEPAQR